jgi:putative transposase
MLREFCRKRPKGQGRRKFKSAKRDLPSINYTRNGFSLRDGRLVLAGGIVLPVVWSRDLPSEPSSVRVYRDSLGHWYASFVVEREVQELPEASGSVGIDWGVSTVATASEPEFDLPAYGFAKSSAQKLARYQRMMSRRKPKPGQKASRGYRGAKRLAAKTHKKVARQRQDVSRKWATKVVRENQNIAVEDFKPKFLAKSTMARKAADNAVATAKSTLVEYAKRAGRTVVLVDPAYTTMDCSGCGARAKQRLLLSERVYACESCGLVETRDRNAARVVLARAGLAPVGVEAVRLPSPRTEKLAEPRIPALQGRE